MVTRSRWLPQGNDHHDVMVTAPRGPALDPICGMFVDPHTAPQSAHNGFRTVYFCCPRCLAAYVPADPDPAEVTELPLGPNRELPTSA